MAATELVRHPRRVRLAHAAVYLSTLPLLGTGWWLVAGGEGNPSPLARALGLPDARLHVWIGWGLAGAMVLTVLVAARRLGALARETFRADRGDGRWWLRWPAGVFTGRFARHEGRFDPGQRVANVVLIGGLFVLVATGVTMTMIHGGPVFVWMARIHRWTTFVITPVILGHVLIAAGVLPGYWGVWRSMHLGGRVPEATARRLWPGWTERELDRPASVDPSAAPATKGDRTVSSSTWPVRPVSNAGADGRRAPATGPGRAGSAPNPRGPVSRGPRGPGAAA